MIEEYIAKLVDHTALKPTTTWDEIQTLCNEAVQYNAASICIPPCYVAEAKAYLKSYLQSDMKICTVIGFPNGYQTKAVKFNETLEAVKDGADEIDLVINLTNVKNGRYDLILNEIRMVKAACAGKVLKVIVETCALTEEEKIEVCKVVCESGATFIKTSTGFGTNGATVEDVKLFKEIILQMESDTKIKAAGGIRSVEFAKELIQAGADRIGASSLLKM